MPEYIHLSVEYHQGGRIAVVTLQRPEMRNALNALLIQELTAIFMRLSADEKLHGVVLTGAAPTFCAGADIAEMREAINFSAEQNFNAALQLGDMLHAINSCRCAVLARVNGDALGGGVGLIAACDIAIATEDVRLAFSEVKLGIAPAVISPYVLAKIGAGNARTLFITGERFSAQRAHRIGLLHAVVPAQHLDDAVDKALNELLSAGPLALRASKRLALTVGQMDAESARTYTAHTIADLRVSAEGQEGLQSFLEKRRPGWTR